MEQKQTKIKYVLIILLVILIVAVLLFGGYFVWKLETKNNSQVSSTNNINNNNQEVVQQVNNVNAENSGNAENEETKEEYMNSCAVYAYKDIARNPNTYKGKRAKLTGEVIQVQQYGNEITIRVNITKKDGYYDDTILTGYKYADDYEDRVLEGDIITVYGELSGTVTYTSVLGADITVPAIKTKYLVIKK